ncbi:Serine racemase [Porphyridium purpureum]|uniref:Serine racemase n=1 Tax=Porphyridium purpureum TaxID=35688 RepID=A0A5J4Z3S0_PORPP|nr:Serine racemase [Porphyridium purpureum]|eukprot:POR3658..scf295_1
MAGRRGDAYDRAALLQACREAERRLKGRVRYTAVHEMLASDLFPSQPALPQFSNGDETHVFFKLETQQLSGSFKIRGALNAILQLPSGSHVIAHSSGNHAAAVALAARVHDCEATIVVPASAPRCKTDLVRQFGGRLEFCENSMEAREQRTEALREMIPHAHVIPPFNDERVIAGQSTIAAEFLSQVPDLEAIIVPVSGGGMISGIALVAKHFNPQIKIYAAEPCGKTGDRADVYNAHRRPDGLGPSSTDTFISPDTIADGLRATPGSITWPIINDLVDAVIVVDETEIVSAMQICFEQLKLVVEPSSAVGVAALRQALLLRGTTAAHAQPQLASMHRIGVILCGANVDLGALWHEANAHT